MSTRLIDKAKRGVSLNTLAQTWSEIDDLSDGLPLEIYAFAKTTNWEMYETIQADIFDHLLAMVGEFGLRVFQDPIVGES
jgi:hypothetical protein